MLDGVAEISMQPEQEAAAVPPSQPVSLGKGEVIMTADQARAAKLQKGFVLQPIIPSAEPEPSSLPEKRERKRSNHFGHSPEPEGVVLPSPRPYRPRPRPTSMNGSPMPEPAVIGVPTPFSERKRILQDRLKRINAQIRACSQAAQAAQMQVMLPSQAPFLSTIHESRVHTPTANGDGAYLGASNKRKASLERERSFSVSRMDLPPKRPRSARRLGDRLVPYGKLRNIYFHCEKLLESLMKDALAKLYFNVPVDPIALGIPHYRQIIEEPMDLGTIKERLQNEYYDDVVQLHADLSLVWDNVSHPPNTSAGQTAIACARVDEFWQATHFNPPGTDVHESAKVLRESTEKRIKKLPKLPGAPGSLELAGVEGGGEMGQRKIADIMRKMEKMQSDLAVMKQGSGERRTTSTASSAGPAQKKRASTGAPGKKAMSFEEKRQLSLNINKLDEDKLGKVVEIIKKRKANIMGKDSEEIEIDIDSLDNATLRELEKYVDECLRPKPQAQKLSKQAQLQSAARQAVGGAPAKETPASSSDSESDSDSDNGLAAGVWGDQLGD